jgi:hypothetical protein
MRPSFAIFEKNRLVSLHWSYRDAAAVQQDHQRIRKRKLRWAIDGREHWYIAGSNWEKA